MSNDLFYESEPINGVLARAYFNIQSHIVGNPDKEYNFYSSLIDGSLTKSVTFYPDDVLNGQDYSAYFSILMQTSGISKFVITDFGRYTNRYFPVLEMYSVYYFNKDTHERIDGPQLDTSMFNTEITLPANCDGRILIGYYNNGNTVNLTLNPSDLFRINFM